VQLTFRENLTSFWGHGWEEGGLEEYLPRCLRSLCEDATDDNLLISNLVYVGKYIPSTAGAEISLSLEVSMQILLVVI
jgi:hypothetical protein